MVSRWAALSVGAAIAIAVTLLLAFGSMNALELPIRDFALRRLPSRPAQRTVIVAIDQRSLREIGRWPWPRTTIADVVDRVAGAGAQAVVLDVLLAEEWDGDAQLAAALRRLPGMAVAGLDEREWSLPAPLLRAAATPVHGNFEVDRDGIARRLASTKQTTDRSLVALPVQAAATVTSRPIAIGQSIAPMFRTRPRMIPQLSAADVLRDPQLASRLRGKIVFFGPTALALGDRYLTSVSARPDPGVTVHAAATESIIRGESVRSMPPILAGLLVGLAVALIVAARATRRMTLLTAAVILFVAIAGGLLLFAITGTAIPFATATLSVLIATATIEAIRMTDALRQSDAVVTRLKVSREQEAESKRVLAHELKTPLASMRGLSQLLSQFELSDAERRRVASLLENEAGKLQSMVTGLLDLERLPLRDFDSSTSVIDLGAVVRNRVEFLQASTERQLILSAPAGVLVRADAALIDRVVDNLVGNALKYSPSPLPVMITAHASGGSASIDVDDRGPGISDSDRQRVFDRFFRGSSASGTQGLGLGLSLVAEVARWHGGSVSVDAAPDRGSRFRFTLPLAATMAKAGAV